MIEKIKKLYKENPKELFLRGLSFFLSSLILPNIIIFAFLIYMKQNGFFSYDFFIDGLFGMKLFFFVAISMFFLLSIYIASGVVAFFCLKYKACKLGSVWWIFLLNIVAIVSTVILVYENTMTITGATYIFVLSFAIHFHIGMLIFSNAKQQFISLLLFLFIVFSILLKFQEETTKLISFSLKVFGMGGNLNTKVTNLNKDAFKGKLILITPSYVYLKNETNKVTSIHPIINLTNIEVSRD